MMAYLGARFFLEEFTGRKLPLPFKGTVWIWFGVTVVVSFGVLRNLPWRAWFGN